MKQLIFSGILLAAGIAAPTASHAQTAPRLAPGVIAFTKEDKTYYATPVAPDFVVGNYKYEGKGEPIVDLTADHKGAFQAHQVPAIPLTWWGLECDADGKPVLQTSPDGTRGQYILVVRYGPGGKYNYTEGNYDRMQLTYTPDKIYILGEREKPR